MNEWVQQESLNQQLHTLLGYIHPTVPSLHHQTQWDGDPLELSETSLIPLQTCNTSTDIYPSPPVWSVYHLSYLNASQNDDNPIDSVINPVISGDGNQPSIEDQLSLPESISSVPYLSQGLLYLFSLEFRKITFHKTPTKRRKRLWHCLLSLIGHSH